MQLPAMATGIPMTYMVDGRQVIVVAVGATGVPAKLVALALPQGDAARNRGPRIRIASLID